ncbi:MAG TPA: enoyl-CoA hydratase/isomerase family protein [Alphaproteobacteria bacterium]|nr:enoyl-CoA hydratase/isomerase family protein [Alphaproteobacteria bacterium]
MSAAYENIMIERQGAAFVVTLARAEKLNPIDWATIKELRSAIAEIDASDALAVILTGSGRSFSAGGDLDGYIALYQDKARFRAFLDDFFAMLDEIERSTKIYIAAVNGVCVAGGLELLLACDISIAADTAKIGDGHLNFGQLPGAGGSQRLPHAIGLLRAKHLILSGKLLTAVQAAEIGLVGEVVPAAELMFAAAAWVETLAEKSPVGVRGAKYLTNLTLTMPMEQGLKAEMDYVHNYATTEPDATEGLIAFRDKRKPEFGK